MNNIKFTDAGEKVLTTFVQTVLAFLIGTRFDSVGFWEALGLTCAVAGANAVKTLLTLWVPVIQNFWLDLTYRVGSSFLVTLAGFAVGAEWLDLIRFDFWQASAYSAGVAALAILKGAIAKKFVDDTITPASFAKAA